MTRTSAQRRNTGRVAIRNQQVSGSSPLAGSRFTPFVSDTYRRTPRAAFRGACSWRVHIGCRSRSSGVPASTASLLAGRSDRAIARPIIRSRRPSRGGSTWTSRMALLDRDERLRHGGLIGYVLELLTVRCPELEHQERASLPAARTAARHVRYDLLPASPTLPSCSANRNRKRIARPHGVDDSAQRAPLKKEGTPCATSKRRSQSP